LLNASADLVDLSPDCCGFAAWGGATGDGQTRVGGNLQGSWNAKSEHPLLVVRKPDYGLATVCSGSVGMMTCSRGMNETGVATTPQGSETPWIEVDGSCYAGMHSREVLEGVAAGPNLVPQIVEVFEEYPRCGSSLFLFAQGRPGWDNSQPDQIAVVIEHDYHGVTPRLPSHNALHGNLLTETLVVTNHCLLRETPHPQPCLDDSVQRYDAMVTVLQEHAIAGLSDMQEVLIACDPSGWGQESVYLEPDSGLIHVAFRPGPDAPFSPHLTPVTFRWEDLFAPIGD
jgi:hypothetical protein